MPGLDLLRFLLSGGTWGQVHRQVLSMFQVKLSGQVIRLSRLEELDAIKAQLEGKHFSLVYERPSGLVGVVFLSGESDGTFRATYGPEGFPLARHDRLGVADLYELVDDG